MISRHLHVCLLLGIFGTCLVYGLKNPGLQLRITSKGLQKANDVAMDEISRSVQKTKFEPQSGSSHGFHYKVDSIAVKKFTKPSSSSLSVKQGSGLEWKANNIEIGLSAHWELKYKKIIHIKTHGSVDITVENLSFTLGVKIGNNSRGYPTIQASRCLTSIGKVNVKFHGGIASAILNLLRKKVGDAIKKALLKQLCPLFNKAVDEDGQKALDKLKMTTDLGKFFMLDYRLIRSPLFSDSYMETFHKGEVYWKGQQDEDPNPSPALHDVKDNSKMLYVWMSDYTMNSLMYQAQKHNFLSFNLTRKQLPPKGKDALNITCLNTVCIGSFIPALRKMYPNDLVEVSMSSTFPPNITFTNGTINGVLGGILDLYAVPSVGDVRMRDRKYICRLSASMTAKADIRIEDELLFGKLKPSHIDLKMVNSTIKDISPDALSFLLDGAVRKFVDDSINSLGSKGVPLPIKGKVRFSSPKLTVMQNTILIGTDVAYIPTS